MRRVCRFQTRTVVSWLAEARKPPRGWNARLTTTPRWPSGLGPGVPPGSGGRTSPVGRLFAREPEEADLSAAGLNAEAGHGQESLAVGLGDGRQGHRVDRACVPTPDPGADRPGDGRGRLAEVPDIDGLVEPGREELQAVGGREDQPAHRGGVASGVEHRDRLGEVADLGLSHGGFRLEAEQERQGHAAAEPACEMTRCDWSPLGERVQSVFPRSIVHRDHDSLPEEMVLLPKDALRCGGHAEGTGSEGVPLEWVVSSRIQPGGRLFPLLHKPPSEGTVALTRRGIT